MPLNSLLAIGGSSGMDPKDRFPNDPIPTTQFCFLSLTDDGLECWPQMGFILRLYPIEFCVRFKRGLSIGIPPYEPETKLGKSYANVSWLVGTLLIAWRNGIGSRLQKSPSNFGNIPGQYHSGAFRIKGPCNCQEFSLLCGIWAL